jgi:hypothetical protein
VLIVVVRQAGLAGPLGSVNVLKEALPQKRSSVDLRCYD